MFSIKGPFFIMVLRSQIKINMIVNFWEKYVWAELPWCMVVVRSVLTVELVFERNHTGTGRLLPMSPSEKCRWLPLLAFMSAPISQWGQNCIWQPNTFFFFWTNIVHLYMGSGLFNEVGILYALWHRLSSLWARPRLPSCLYITSPLRLMHCSRCCMLSLI